MAPSGAVLAHAVSNEVLEANAMARRVDFDIAPGLSRSLLGVEWARLVRISRLERHLGRLIR